MFVLLSAAVCVACGGASSNPVPPAPPPDSVEIVDNDATQATIATTMIIMSIETDSKVVSVLVDVGSGALPFKTVRLDDRLFDVASREAMDKAVKKTEHLRPSYHEKNNHRPAVSDGIRLCYIQTVGNPVGSVRNY
jgi:hypothetical protein